MGHEYVGIVEEVGSDVSTIKPGQFVVGSFFASDNTCEICRAGYQSRCVRGEPVGANGAQAEYLRVPLAGGTLVATPELPDKDLIPSLLTASDVLGTGWFGAVAAEPARARPSPSSATAPWACTPSSRPSSWAPTDHRDEPARVPAEAGPRVRRHRYRHPGRRHVGYVGVAHGVQLPGDELFFAEVHLLGGPAPVRRFLPKLIDLILKREIDPGKVFGLHLPLDEAAEGYRAMDERRAIKTLLKP